METPNDISEKEFHKLIRRWFKVEEACGPEALKHKNQNKVWTAEEKYELVAKALAGASIETTAIKAGIGSGLLYQWVRKYKMEGYEGLALQQKGRPPKELSLIHIYIVGDKYFKIKSAKHNLVRTRCQIALAKDMLRKMDAMNAIVMDCYRPVSYTHLIPKAWAF